MKTILQRTQRLLPIICTAIKNGHDLEIDFNRHGFDFMHYGKTEMTFSLSIDHFMTEQEADETEQEILTYINNL